MMPRVCQEVKNWLRPLKKVYQRRFPSFSPRDHVGGLKRHDHFIILERQSAKVHVKVTSIVPTLEYPHFFVGQPDMLSMWITFIHDKRYRTVIFIQVRCAADRHCHLNE